MDAVTPRISKLPVLALNAGSSSLKLGLYSVDASLAECELEISEETPARGPEPAVARIQQRLRDLGLPAPAAVGHRVVHGGVGLRQHAVIDASVLVQLEAAAAFAPLHVPAALALIRLAQQYFPGVPHVACLDTAFHRDLPEVARTLPIPRELRAEGVERYGFHGLSCESIVRQLSLVGELQSRLVIAHLGNGASVTAVKNGRSIDTSMGLTPSGGVIMGTRCGDLDPGVLAYLVREKHFNAAQLEDTIDQRSGLLGISGLDGDMRRLHVASASNPDARLAIDMFCYSVRKQVAAMAAALGGIDLLVFTGGIGEHDAPVRASICEGLSWLGVAVDVTSRSGCEVRVMASQENEQIARHSWQLTTMHAAPR